MSTDPIPSDTLPASAIGGCFNSNAGSAADRAHWSFRFAPDSDHVTLQVASSAQGTDNRPLQLLATLDSDELEQLARWLLEVRSQLHAPEQTDD